MKKCIDEAQKYMDNMRNSCIMQLNNPNSIYYNKEGHKRLAREIGYALNDFDEQGQELIIHASYGKLYVTGTNLKPLLDAKEWIAILREQIIK